MKSPGRNEPVTSMSLVARLRTQDPIAWRQLAELYGPLVYAWVRSSGLNEHDAADVVQDVFSSVHTTLDRFRKDRPTDRFRDWLWTIAHRRVCDHFRRRAKQAVAQGGTDAYQRLRELPDTIPTDIDPQAESAETELLRRALELVKNEFEDRTWQACLQTAIEGRQPVDVVNDLGMSLGALYVARSRVLKRLRQELGDIV